MPRHWSLEEEASHLAARFEQLRRGGDMTQVTFAAEYNVPGGAPMISQHVRGRRPIALDAAVAYARGFAVSLGDISPRLASQVAAAAPLLAENPDVLSRLDQALALIEERLADADEKERDALATNMGGWARAGGGEPWLSIVRALLETPTKRQAAA